MTSADEILAGDWLDVDPDEYPDGGDELALRVDSLQHADQVGRAIRVSEHEIARVKAMVGAQIEELLLWADVTMRPHERRVEYLRSVLERYHLAEKERLGARAPKTIHLPSGDLKLRAVPLSINVTDAAAVVDALEAEEFFHAINRPPAPDPKPAIAEIRRLAERKQRGDGSWGMALYRDDIGSCDPEAVAEEGFDYVNDPEGGRWWFLPGLDASPPGDRVTFTPNTSPEAGGEDYNL